MSSQRTTMQRPRKTERGVIGHVRFVLEGEAVAAAAQLEVLSERPHQAWLLLTETLLGPDAQKIEEVARGVLEGRLTLAGDSATGIRPVPSQNPKYLRMVDEVYAGRWKHEGQWYRPRAKVVAHESVPRSPKDPSEAACRVRWDRARVQHYCYPGDVVQAVTVKGVPCHVIFEECGEPPSWRRHNATPQEAVDEMLGVGHWLSSKGESEGSIRSVTEALIDEGLDDEEADDLRALAYEAEDEEHAERLKRIGEAVRAQAGDDTFEMTLLDGRVVTVPRAPFAGWALRPLNPDLAPPWQPVSPSGLKVPNDGRLHSDWMLGAGLDLSEAYKANVSKPAYEEALRIQEEARGRKRYAGIFAALDTLRRASVKATVIVDGGTFEGVVGEDVAVLPDLSPLRVPEIQKAKAVIAATGGPASHLAIVARGRRISVMLVADACETFRAGTRVTIDPKTGTITKGDELVAEVRNEESDDVRMG